MAPRKKKKKDLRVEVDGKPMSKYQRKLMEKGALPEFSEFKGEFDKEIIEEAVELLRDSGAAISDSDISMDRGARIRPDYRTEPCRESFPCAHCGREISPEGAGSGHRNHCPHCLHSLHVDIEPGDRASSCHGDMEPIAIWVKDGGEWAIVHRCKSCGKLSTNRVLADDNPVALMSLAVKALANPPFPLRMLSDYLKGDGHS